MTANMSLTVSAFLAASSLVVLISVWLGRREGRVATRLRELSGGGATVQTGDGLSRLTQSALPKIGNPLVPEDAQQRSRLKGRLIHAGLYSPHAMPIFLGVKVLLTISPVLVGLALGSLGVMPISYGLIIGAFIGAFGLIAPSFWLDARKASRQTSFRRSLPDALDVVVICLEGGLTLDGALQRVAQELGTAHPLLGGEMNIALREIELGRSASEALRHFASRSDLAEVRGLASVIHQSERLGASMVNALRVHADTLRLRRHQLAEEKGHKAATKMLFPTLLFILPAMFIVILGPAGIQIMDLFTNVNNKAAATVTSGSTPD